MFDLGKPRNQPPAVHRIHREQLNPPTLITTGGQLLYAMAEHPTTSLRSLPGREWE